MATNHSIPVGHIGVGDAFEKKVHLIAGVEMLKREADDFAAVQGGGAYSEEIKAHSVDVQGVRLHVEREMRQAFADGTLVPLFWQDGALVKFAGELENVPHRWRSYAPTCLFVGGSDRASSAVFLEDRHSRLGCSNLFAES